MYNSENDRPLVDVLAAKLLANEEIPEPTAQRLSLALSDPDDDESFMAFVSDLCRAVTQIDSECVAELATGPALPIVLNLNQPGGDQPPCQLIMVRPREWSIPPKIDDVALFERTRFLAVQTGPGRRFGQVGKKPTRMLLAALRRIAAHQLATERFRDTMEARLPILREAIRLLKEKVAANDAVGTDLLRAIENELTTAESEGSFAELIASQNRWVRNNHLGSRSVHIGLLYAFIEALAAHCNDTLVNVLVLAEGNLRSK